MDQKTIIPRLLWDPFLSKGYVPEARESSTMVTYKNCLLLFGGIGTEIFNSIYELPLKGDKWRKVKVKTP